MVRDSQSLHFSFLPIFAVMKKKNSLQKAVKKARRELAVFHGAYDGRFAPKIILNKKKEKNKNACRNYRHFLSISVQSHTFTT